VNGVHDMGGLECFGSINPDPTEALFHAEWEKRVLALTVAMGATGQWNLDQSRFARESIPPSEYLSIGYYRIWLRALEKLLIERDLVTQEELDKGIMLKEGQKLSKKMLVDQVEALLRKGASVERSIDQAAQFAKGDKVVVRNIHTPTHTRLPSYIRGKQGVIDRIHGAHPHSGFTTLSFKQTSFGALHDDSLRSYMSIAGSLISRRLYSFMENRNASVNDALNAIDSIPREEGQPVFAEPWQAEAFAMTLMLYEKGVFTWVEWAEALSTEIKQAQANGDPDLGDTYYNHWLAALERLVVNKGISSKAQLSDLYNQWDAAAKNTPHGEPITL